MLLLSNSVLTHIIKNARKHYKPMSKAHPALVLLAMTISAVFTNLLSGFIQTVLFNNKFTLVSLSCTFVGFVVPLVWLMFNSSQKDEIPRQLYEWRNRVGSTAESHVRRHKAVDVLSKFDTSIQFEEEFAIVTVSVYHQPGHLLSYPLPDRVFKLKVDKNLNVEDV